MDIQILRHSTSHILAQAVKELYPEVKLGIGPAIKDGFYYDFKKDATFNPEELLTIEKEMKAIIARDLRFKKTLISKEKAIKLFREKGEDLKVELLEEITEDEVSLYGQGEFLDLCRGPHIESTGQVKVFKLLSIAGAYWRGNENNPMLQRIYGTAFEKKNELTEFLKLREEALKRDHRKLGKELDYYSIHPDIIGAGLILYHPKGAMLRNILEDFEKREHLKRGYQLVIGPHILKSDIWIKSGHYDYYKESMYIFQVEKQEYAIKPMNCPGHMLVYKSHIRSYRDLPIRYFELGDVYRHEKTGVLHGLLRVRGFTQDDAHIFCLPEQLTAEITGVIDFVVEVMNIFGFNDLEVELSTRPLKHIGTDSDWQRARKALVDALREKRIDYSVNEGEGAFYGPKIDVKLKDALGRSWQCATIQCDFALPERFDLTYVAPSGQEERPIMLHRVILGSMERFIGALLEHYAGAMPLWLAPLQVVIIPVTSKQNDYAHNLQNRLMQAEIRAEVDQRGEKMGKKIRNAEIEKVPYMLIVGEKEAAGASVSVRMRSKGDEGVMSLDKFIDRLTKEIKDKKL